MDERTSFIAEVETFLVKSGMTASALGRLALNDGHFVRRMREGSGVTLATVSKVRNFMQRPQTEDTHRE